MAGRPVPQRCKKVCIHINQKCFQKINVTFIIKWENLFHQEFEVPYHCLSEEIKIGDYYLRLLLEEDDVENEEYSAIKRS